MCCGDPLRPDIAPHRLEFAQKMGADHTVLVDKTPPEELARRIHETLGCEPDVTLECSGAGPSICTGIYVCVCVCVRVRVCACMCVCVRVCEVGTD